MVTLNFSKENKIITGNKDYKPHLQKDDKLKTCDRVGVALSLPNIELVLPSKKDIIARNRSNSCGDIILKKDLMPYVELSSECSKLPPKGKLPPSPQKSTDIFETIDCSLINLMEVMKDPKKHQFKKYPQRPEYSTTKELAEQGDCTRSMDTLNDLSEISTYNMFDDSLPVEEVFVFGN
ncbi:hypothetical protein SNEBB_007012 [Seison nebaliae]|nr:hypothetical protein SNEBB_007012 [Seison nebaliae]